MRGRPPEIGVGSVSLTFIWTMLPAGAVSSRMLNVSSLASLPCPPPWPTPSASRAVTIAGRLPRMARQGTTRRKDCGPDSAMAASEAS